MATTENKLLEYDGFIPPCGIYCGGCPNYKRENNRCEGAEKGCKTRKCKSIYVCCIEKKGLEFCHQCKSYPCSRYRKFAASWQKYGQNLLENQEFIKTNGKEEFVRKMNKNARIAKSRQRDCIKSPDRPSFMISLPNLSENSSCK